MQKTLDAIITVDNNQQTKSQSAFAFPKIAAFRPSWLQLISIGIVAIVMLPLVYLGIRAFDGGWENIDYLMKSRTLTIIKNSLLLVGAVTLSTGAIGIPFAWLTTRTDLPLRRVWLVLGLLTMVIPSYIAAVTYIAAFGPVGILRDLLQPFGVVRLPDIRGFWGAWLAITLFTYPYVVLPVRAALLNADPALEEAGHSMGLGRWRVFWQITFPQLRPAMLSGMVLAGMYALSDFGAVMIMRFNVFTSAIYLRIGSFQMERVPLLALVLIAFTIGLLAIEWKFSSQTKNYRIGTGTKRQLKRVKLGIWKIPALIFCAILAFLGVGVPVGVMLSWVVSSVDVSSNIDLRMSAMLGNTVQASLFAAIVVMLAAFPLGLLAIRQPTRMNKSLVALAYTGNVLPGIVIGLALVFFGARYMPAIYQTIPLLVIGYATRFLPFGISATRSALTQVNPRIEEAARSLGLNQWQVIWRIIFPLARTGMIAGAALVFLSAMKELPTTLLLQPIGFNTFSTRIWSFYEEASLELIGAPGFVLMGVSAIALLLIVWRDNSIKQ